MPTIGRIGVALVLLTIALFTVFGFLATFEPPGHLAWRIGYTLGGFLSLSCAAWVLIRK